MLSHKENFFEVVECLRTLQDDLTFSEYEDYLNGKYF